MSNAPFDPDPECPFCSGDGYRRLVGDGFDQVGRCECTNWSVYAELRRTKGLTMKQAIAELEKRTASKAVHHVIQDLQSDAFTAREYEVGKESERVGLSRTGDR
jgi:hypothetical protein